jgi:hypothetical protein
MTKNQHTFPAHMKRALFLGAASLTAAILLGPSQRLAAQTTTVKPPEIFSLSKPQAGETQIIFHGNTGPFQVQSRSSFAASAPWSDVGANVIQIQPTVFMATFPMGKEDKAYYRILSAGETIAELKGWTLLPQVSAPANGVYFAAGESPVVTVTILDNSASGVGRADFATLNFYLSGPLDPQKNVSAVKLMGASVDRSKNPHHYIDFKTNAKVQVSRNVLTYTLQPVTDEAPGTYTAAIYAVLGTDVMQQTMKFVDLQIGTATVETPVVSKTSCVSCHLGTISGKMYMHHADVGRSPVGSFALDYESMRSCRPCHNNDGYAAYNDASVPGGKVPDAIVLRVHGVHMGKGLKSDFNTNSATGNFRDYKDVVFPANIKDCTVCHKDDRWKTAPTRAACGSCHDNTWFGPEATMPAGREAHVGGDFDNDATCAGCHKAALISKLHVETVKPPAFQQTVAMAMSAPANGKYYAAGDKPTITIKITDVKSGALVNPTSMVDPLISTNVAANEWRRANLFVSGPRADTVPVLTTAAALASPTASYANNELRFMRDEKKRDARVTRTDDSIVYQLDDVAKLTPGTYTVYADILPAAFPGGSGYINFQVGTTNIEPVVAGNCIDCHADERIHATSRAAQYIPDVCKSCHDNLHQLNGKTNWTTSQFGFGVSPLSHRVHGIHFGNYVDKPKEINGDFSHVIFPQDVRNCTKCHVSSSWNERPSRLSCLACHDTDAALTHGKLNTYDPTPDDAFSGDEIETCEVCHGSDSEFSAKKAHAITNPYVPPYPRALRGE